MQNPLASQEDHPKVTVSVEPTFYPPNPASDIMLNVSIPLETTEEKICKELNDKKSSLNEGEQAKKAKEALLIGREFNGKESFIMNYFIKRKRNMFLRSGQRLWTARFG